MLHATYRSPDSTAPAAAYLCVQRTEVPLVPVTEPDLGQNIDLNFFSHTGTARPTLFQQPPTGHMT